jgi:hypothetical protein
MSKSVVVEPWHSYALPFDLPTPRDESVSGYNFRTIEGVLGLVLPKQGGC